MFSLEFTIFSYTVMYLFPAPPPPPVKILQNISFVLLGLQYPEQILETIVMQFLGGRGGGGLEIRCIIVMYWGFTYLERKFELSNAASISD